MTCHLKVSNFKNLDAVNYSLIKLFGFARQSETCAFKDKLQFSLDTYSSETKVYNNTFKFICQLQLGRNQINIQYCCGKISLIIDYSPHNSTYSIVPLYVISEGHDGCFQAPETERNTIESAFQRIDLCVRLLQCVTAEKLADHSLGRRTFRVEGPCQVFYSKLNYLEARKKTQLELWNDVGKEIMKKLGAKDKKYLAFLSCTHYCGEKYSKEIQTYEELIKITDGYIALGGGDLALFGTACLYTWPERFDDIVLKFTDNTLVDRSEFLDDSCYRGTRGTCFSTTLGSVLHELYHTFNLGHTKHGIMARGFDNIYKFFVNEEVPKNDPKSGIISVYHSSIEFKEEFGEPGIQQYSIPKKNFVVMKKNEEIDDTDLTKSCAVLLFFHKWFNNIGPKVSQLTFDLCQNLIKSTAGIRVVQIRSLEEELVLYDWIFIGKVLKFCFQIPEHVTEEQENNKLVLFVEDNAGNILKTESVFGAALQSDTKKSRSTNVLQ